MSTLYDYCKDGRTLMSLSVHAEHPTYGTGAALLWDGFALYPIDRGMAVSYLRGWRWLARGGSQHNGVTLTRTRF